MRPDLQYYLPKQFLRSYVCVEYQNVQVKGFLVSIRIGRSGVVHFPEVLILDTGKGLTLVRGWDRITSKRK